MIKGRLVSIDCRLLSPADSFLPLQQLFDKFVRLADFNPQMLHILGLAYFELALLMSNALASKAAELNKLNKGLFHFLFLFFRIPLHILSYCRHVLSHRWLRCRKDYIIASIATDTAAC